MNVLDLYDIIRGPVITEKASSASEQAQVVLRVSMDATKPQIKEAVEKVFRVKVKAVNTLIRKGKTRKFKGREGVRSSYKRAIITLENGFSIDVTSPEI